MRLALAFLYLVKGIGLLQKTLQQLFTPIAFPLVVSGTEFAFTSFQVQRL